MKAVSCGNFAELCSEYGISRKTGYKWRERFVAQGIEGMEEESRRPHGHSETLEEEVVCRMIRLKQAHPHWGPRKIRELYERKHKAGTPSESSFKRILERAGLTEKRRCRKVKEGGRIASGRKASGPNEVWTVDFKGWWLGSGGDRVEPLTVRDEYSRMVLEVRHLENARTETVRACFEGLFEKHGLPEAIRSDNGVPFASTGLMGLSRLSAWWLALGIDLERSRPGCPQDNGAHERVHLDIWRELESGRMGRDQPAFDLWRQEYNTVRPHEGLGMATPSEVYRPSDRMYEGTPEQLDYEGMSTRRVRTGTGTICYQGEVIRLSSAIGGWDVGLGPKATGEVEVWFSNLLLGHIDPSTSAFTPVLANAGRGQIDPLAASATLQRPKDRITNKSVAKPSETCNP